MTESERIKLLINFLEGGNASAFARKIGISKANISKMRAGTVSLRLHINSILAAYPAVSREWLTSGQGYPGDISVDIVKSYYEDKLKRNESFIDLLIKRNVALEKELKKYRASAK